MAVAQNLGGNGRAGGASDKCLRTCVCRQAVTRVASRRASKRKCVACTGGGDEGAAVRGGRAGREGFSADSPARVQAWQGVEGANALRTLVASPWSSPGERKPRSRTGRALFPGPTAGGGVEQRGEDVGEVTLSASVESVVGVSSPWEARSVRGQWREAGEGRKEGQDQKWRARICIWSASCACTYVSGVGNV